jgi:hypothetical protein
MKHMIIIAALFSATFTATFFGSTSAASALGSTYAPPPPRPQLAMSPIDQLSAAWARRGP